MAEKNGRQVYHVCPLILHGFWKAYIERQPKEATMGTLLLWAETVPINLRKKIKVYEDNFFSFEDLVGTKLEGAISLILEGVLDTEASFDPNVWLRDRFKGSDITLYNS